MRIFRYTGSYGDGLIFATGKKRIQYYRDNEDFTEIGCWADLKEYVKKNPEIWMCE